MVTRTGEAYFDDLPTLDPVISYEINERGWRGVTEHGEVLDVKGPVGQPPPRPPETIVVVMTNGERIGNRAVLPASATSGKIEAYLHHFNRATVLFKRNDLAAALDAIDAALSTIATVRGKFNRALILLSLGHWPEGFEDYERRLDLQMPPMCAQVADAIPRWRGEDILGKRLLLVHDAGFGDTVMMLRYVPQLLALGAIVSLFMPPELRRLAEQFAPVVDDGEFDFYCPALSLLNLLAQTVSAVPAEPYLRVDPTLTARWREQLEQSEDPTRKRIGIAWSIGKQTEGDYPRAVPLKELTSALGRDCKLFSLQTQGAEEAAALGVTTFPFEDFADCAAFTALMDEVITVDTAALHVAGAIGHPHVTALLSHWASWRWHHNPFYPRVKLARQTRPHDWASALAQI